MVELVSSVNRVNNYLILCIMFTLPSLNQEFAHYTIIGDAFSLSQLIFYFLHIYVCV